MCFRRKKKVESKVNTSSNEWLDALGGSDNVVNVNYKGSRLIVDVNNRELVNQTTLHNLGASNLIMGENKVSIILGDNAQNIADLIKK